MFERAIRYMTAIKMTVAEYLSDHDVPVGTEEVLAELKAMRTMLDDEIKELEAQIDDSK